CSVGWYVVVVVVSGFKSISDHPFESVVSIFGFKSLEVFMPHLVYDDSNDQLWFFGLSKYPKGGQ
ncbi:MAG: hypothetical protein RLN82_12200, partial [Pseudomonadales bacterium]